MKKIFAILLAVTALAFAENHSHDGFFINAQAGLGYYGISSDGFYDDISENGLGESFNLKVGAALNENVVLHLGLGLLSYSNTDAELNHLDAEVSTLGLLIGPGVTLFPVKGGALDNIFVTATVGFNLDYFSYDFDSSLLDDDSNTALGFGALVGFGKEWWIANTWSLGVGLNYKFSYGGDSDIDDASWSTNSVQLVVTISHN